MRIQVLAGDLDELAGSACYSGELAIRLANRGHEVSVLCFASTPQLRERCRVFEIGRSRHRAAPVIWRFAHQLDERHVARELTTVPLERADICLGLEHMMLRPYGRRMKRTPMVYVPLSLVAPIEIQSYGLNRIATWASVHAFMTIQRWALKMAAATVRFTHLSCQSLIDYYGVESVRRFVVLPMPIKCPSAHERVRQAETIECLTVGRLISSKNVRFAIEALEQTGASNWRFHIVGEGEDRARLETFVRSRRLSDQVLFHGRQPSLDLWFNRCHAFLFTSKVDNCPLAVLEAMSYGRPVIAMQGNGRDYISGVAELIDHERNGWLAQSEEHYIKLLRSLLNDPSHLNLVGERARETAATRHNWDAHIAGFEKVFEEVK